MDYLLCGNLPYPAWKKHISVQNLSNRRIRRYLVCRLKRPEARDFSHVRFTILVLFLFISGYMLYQTKKSRTSFWVKVIMICGIAGSLCSLIDKLFWGGSLDFLQIPTLFIFDLKDCYLTVAEVIFVVIGILHSKEISVKEYLYFVCNKFNL